MCETTPNLTFTQEHRYHDQVARDMDWPTVTVVKMTDEERLAANDPYYIPMVAFISISYQDGLNAASEMYDIPVDELIAETQEDYTNYFTSNGKIAPYFICCDAPGLQLIDGLRQLQLHGYDLYAEAYENYFMP